MLSVLMSLADKVIIDYHKQPCIICRNLPLKGFSGMWVQIIH